MRSPLFLLFLGLACLTGCSGGVTGQKEKEDKRPNIVVILADDLGYSDVGCYGGEISTPALDSLAQNGLRFTQFYNVSRCCPTRASLMTGLYPHQAGIGGMTHDNKTPGYRGYLTENTVTIAELLRAAGYHTGMVGKWHISQTEELPKEEHLKWLAHQVEKEKFSPLSQYPTARGFDKYYGNLWGVVDYFDPFSLVNGITPVKSVPKDYYHTTAIGDSAVAYVEKFTKDEKPFFLYVAHTAPHWPLQAPHEDIAKYENTYQVGWEAIRNARYDRMVKMGLLEEKSAPLSPWMFPEKKWDTNSDQEFDARAMAVHAAMVDRMDQTIGKLVQKLKDKGELDNTIIFFLSDNGTSSERPSKYGPGFDRAGSTRQGVPVVFPVDKQALPGSQMVHSGIGPEWASVGNTPFRYFKAKLHEGGMNTPFIVHWPAKVKNKGGFSRQPAHVMDIMATCLDASGATYPQTFEGRPLTPMAGKSFLGALLGKEQPGHETIFWEHLGAAALRQGNWKLVRLGAKAKWELYDLAQDRTETNNLADQNPGKVTAMAQVWEKMAQEQNVYPGPGSH
ncbi:arylsulfatase [Rufibacter radiotolerans]|uniref:Arylsulfatase n=1 Tax=Rufibacter radiotolerans TaxID=1379910 RepID=A0A0H4VK56_9BACT|nr:arylsulfatase [Rufibacter radiotolerans]AKQ46175.1 arylsulfatase [Rufibacter radiotolerans]